MVKIRNNFYCCSFVLTVLAITVSLIPTTLQHAIAVGCTNWAGLPDADCDGLADAWENAGYYDPNNDGKRINLPGANPQHKDLFVEIDSMSGMAPSSGAIADVIAAYAGANVWNPDGTGGVRLYVESTTSPPITYSTCTTIWPGFDALKAANIGSATDRASNPLQLQEESNVKVYGLFVHFQCGDTGSSGTSENPGNDFAVSLGSFTGGTGNRMQQASALMHELGHTLGLDHGGSAPTPDCKPNFLSVMNTEFQFADDVPGRLLDYSRNRGSLPPGYVSMDPLLAKSTSTGLDESKGIGTGLPTPPPPTTVVGHENQPTGRDIIRVPTDHSAVNFNWYTGNTNSRDIGVHSAVHDVGRPHCDNTTNNTPDDLYGYWDWAGAAFWSWSYRNVNYQPASSINTTPMTQSDGSNTTVPNTTIGQQNNNDNKSVACNPLETDCNLSPCDPNDKACTFVKGTNLTESENESYDYGNRTNTHQDQSFEDIKTVFVSNLISLDNKIQKLPNSAFNSSANATDVKRNFNDQLAVGEDNLAKLVSEGNFTTAILRLEKIETSLSDLIAESYSTQLVTNVKYLIGGLTNMLPDNTNEPHVTIK